MKMAVTKPDDCVKMCSGKPMTVTGPALADDSNSCSSGRILSASSQYPSWFMSTICTFSPWQNGSATFWFSGLPSPRIGLPGRPTRLSHLTPPSPSEHT